MAAEVRRLETASAAVAPALAAMIEQARAEGYEAGRAAGADEAGSRVRDLAAESASALRTVVEQEVARLNDAGGAHDDATLELAIQIATYVVDAVDTSAVDEVARRIRAALDQIDDDKVVAHVHPHHVGAVRSALTGTGVRVEASQDVAGGDARLVGRWSVADLSIDQRWSAVRELLDAAS